MLPQFRELRSACHAALRWRRLPASSSARIDARRPGPASALPRLDACRRRCHRSDGAQLLGERGEGVGDDTEALRPWPRARSEGVREVPRGDVGGLRLVPCVLGEVQQLLGVGVEAVGVLRRERGTAVVRVRRGRAAVGVLGRDQGFAPPACRTRRLRRSVAADASSTTGRSQSRSSSWLDDERRAGEVDAGLSCRECSDGAIRPCWSWSRTW